MKKTHENRQLKIACTAPHNLDKRNAANSADIVCGIVQTLSAQLK